MNRLSWTCAILLAAAWLVSLHVQPWSSWHNEVLALAAVLAGCVGALVLQLRAGDRARVLLPSLALLPAFIGAWALLQWLTGRIAYAGTLWTVLAYVAVCIGAAALGHAAVRAQESSETGKLPPLQVLAWVLVVIGLVQLFIVLNQTLQGEDAPEWIVRSYFDVRGAGNLGQPNHAGLLFAMAIAAAAYLQLRGLLRPAIGGLLLLALLGGLATTQSRSALLGALLVLAWALLRRRSLPVRPLAGVALAALGLAMFIAWPRLVAAYWFDTGAGLHLTASGRVDLWSQLLQAVWLRPWVGWGVGQVAQAQNAIAHLYHEVLPATFAHHLLLDFALWMGVPALLFATGLILKWSWPRVRAAADADSWFCVALVLPFALHALTEFPHAYTYFLVPVFFALGALDALSGRTAGLRLPRGVAIGAVALWVAGSAVAAVEYVELEDDFRYARFEALHIGEPPVGRQPPRILLLTQLDALVQGTRMQLYPGMSTYELDTLRNLAMLHPWTATTSRYAIALALNGRQDEAVRQLQVLRATQGARTYRRTLEAIDEKSAQFPVLKQLPLP